MRGSLRARLDKALPAAVARELRRIGKLGEQRGLCVFIVGGMVRDIVLGYPTTDFDVTVEGDAVSVARDYAREVGGAVKGITGFGTCKVSGGPLGVVDFASTRTETYRRPGALPDVKRVPDIIADLDRRDFALNAMAVHLSTCHYGEIIDPFGGWGDIKRKQLTALHPGSFSEDPTRILRGVRFAVRYGYHFERYTLGFLTKCVAGGCLQTVSGKRVRRELELIFSEPEAAAGIRLMAHYGILESIDRSLRIDAGKRRFLAAAGRAQGRFREWMGAEGFDPRVFWFGYMCVGLRQKDAARLVTYFNLDRKVKQTCLWVSGDLGGTKARLSKLRPPYAYKVTRLLKNLPLESLALLYGAAGAKGRKLIKTYVTTWRNVTPAVSGVDLARLGIKEGPAVGRLLERIHELKLLGKLPDKRAELSFARKHAGTQY